MARGLVASGVLAWLIASGSPGWTADTPRVEKVGTTIEAWYHTTPEPPAPAPLPPPTPEPLNPYAADTLHVGTVGGQEQARAYIDLDTEELPFDGELTDASLTLPVDPNDGTLLAADAQLRVCTAVIGPEQSTEGSFATPPDIDCAVEAVAIHVAKPFEHFLVDLSGFELLDLSTKTLAIVPSDRAKEASATWHVAFYGRNNKTEGARPISAELTIGPADTPPLVDTPETDTTMPGAPSFDTGTFDPIETGTVVPPTDEPAARFIAVQTAALAEELEAVQAATYTAVWMVPLVLLAFSIYFGSALTRPVVVRGDAKDSLARPATP